jgi:hypothetical protein
LTSNALLETIPGLQIGYYKGQYMRFLVFLLVFIFLPASAQAKCSLKLDTASWLNAGLATSSTHTCRIDACEKSARIYLKNYKSGDFAGAGSAAAAKRNGKKTSSPASGKMAWRTVGKRDGKAVASETYAGSKSTSEVIVLSSVANDQAVALKNLAAAKKTLACE